jgi:hypothetical protein
VATLAIVLGDTNRWLLMGAAIGFGGLLVAEPAQRQFRATPPGLRIDRLTRAWVPTLTALGALIGLVALLAVPWHAQLSALGAVTPLPRAIGLVAASFAIGAAPLPGLLPAVRTPPLPLIGWCLAAAGLLLLPGTPFMVVAGLLLILIVIVGKTTAAETLGPSATVLFLRPMLGLPLDIAAVSCPGRLSRPWTGCMPASSNSSATTWMHALPISATSLLLCRAVELTLATLGTTVFVVAFAGEADRWVLLAEGVAFPAAATAIWLIGDGRSRRGSRRARVRVEAALLLVPFAVDLGTSTFTPHRPSLQWVSLAAFGLSLSALVVSVMWYRRRVAG